MSDLNPTTVPKKRGRKPTHGLSTSPVYKAWTAMLQRCYKPAAKSVRLNYACAGIRVCSEWHKFEAFYRDMAESYRDGLTLDRIDNNKGYSPDNCRWATKEQQARNKSTNVFVKTPHGHVLMMCDAVFAYGRKADRFPRVARPVR